MRTPSSSPAAGAPVTCELRRAAIASGGAAMLVGAGVAGFGAGLPAPTGVLALAAWIAAGAVAPRGGASWTRDLVLGALLLAATLGSLRVLDGAFLAWWGWVAVPLASHLARPRWPAALAALTSGLGAFVGVAASAPWSRLGLASAAVAALWLGVLAWSIDHRRLRLARLERRPPPSLDGAVLRRAAFIAALASLLAALALGVAAERLRPDPPPDVPRPVDGRARLPRAQFDPDLVLARGQRLEGSDDATTWLLRESFRDAMEVFDGEVSFVASPGEGLLLRDEDDGRRDQKIHLGGRWEEPSHLVLDDPTLESSAHSIWEISLVEPSLESMLLPLRSIWLEAETLALRPDGRAERTSASATTTLRVGVGAPLPPDLPWIRADREVALPASFAYRPWLRKRVERWLSGLEDDGERARRLVDEVRRNGRRDPTLPRAEDLRQLLVGLGRGTSLDYASATALLARLAGLPARVALGYRVTIVDGAWTARVGDGRAWTEIAFADRGWVAFDPTPLRETPVEPPAPESTDSDTGADAAPDRGGLAQAEASPDAPSPWTAWLAGWPLLIIVAAGWWFFRGDRASRLARRMAGGRGGSPTGASEWTRWARFVRACARQGLLRTPDQSAREFAAVVRAAGWADRDELSFLVSRYEEGRFGGRSLSPEDARRIDAWLATLERRPKVTAPRADADFRSRP